MLLVIGLGLMILTSESGCRLFPKDIPLLRESGLVNPNERMLTSL
jgi:hypothetical protein